MVASRGFPVLASPSVRLVQRDLHPILRRLTPRCPEPLIVVVASRAAQQLPKTAAKTSYWRPRASISLWRAPTRHGAPLRAVEKSPSCRRGDVQADGEGGEDIAAQAHSTRRGRSASAAAVGDDAGADAHERTTSVNPPQRSRIYYMSSHRSAFSRSPARSRCPTLSQLSLSRRA